MANKPEYRRYTVISKQDPATGQFDIPDYKHDIRHLVEQAVKSALPEGAYYKVSDREILPSGRTKVDVYVHPEHSGVVGESLAQDVERLTFKGSTEEKYSLSRERKVSEKEARQISKEEEASTRDKEKTDSLKSLKKNYMVAVGILATLTDITRRILTSVLNFANQTVKDSVEAHNQGVSYDAMRSYRHIEKQHGLAEGTISSGIATVNKSFANKTYLDEKTLSDLAVVMGAEGAQAMVNVAMNQQNPEKALGMIIDAFMKRAEQGKSSTGEYVGNMGARRELYSYLLKLSPEWAAIFATMQEELHNVNSVYRDQADTYEKWKNLLPTERGLTSIYEKGGLYTLGQEWDKFQETLVQIKELIDKNIAPNLTKMLRWANNLRIGMSESENRQLNIKNRGANLAELVKVNSQIAELEDKEHLNMEEKAFLLTLKDYKEQLEKANKGDLKGNVALAVVTPNELLSDAQLHYAAGMEEAALKGIDVTPDEIYRVIEGYPGLVDVNKEAVMWDKERRGRLISEALERVRSDETFKYYSPMDKYGNRGKDFTERAEALAEVEAFFGIDLTKAYEAEKGESLSGLPRYDAINKLIKYALGKNYLKKDITGTNLLNIDALVTDVTGALSDDDFLMYLYKRHKKAFRNRIAGERGEKAYNDIENSPYASGLLLYDTEGREEDWRNKIPSTYPSAGKLKGYNDITDGEMVYRIVVEANGEETEVAHFMATKAREGYFGTYTRDAASGNVTMHISSGVDNNAAQGITASMTGGKQ